MTISKLVGVLVEILFKKKILMKFFYNFLMFYYKIFSYENFNTAFTCFILSEIELKKLMFF